MGDASRLTGLTLAGALLGVLAGSGCLGSFLVDEVDLDFEELRESMVLVASDGVFSFHAPPGLIGAVEVEEELAFLRRVSDHLTARLGPAPRGPSKVAIYLHDPGAFDDGVIGYSGVASCVEGTFDLVWDGWRDRLRRTAAHELAHLAICARFGSSHRTALTEGLAEYLENTYVEPTGSFGEPRGPAAFFNMMMCDDGWSLENLFANARWLERIEQIDAYSVAALFTEVAIDRVGLERYVARYYLPAGYGTTRAAGSLLERELGLDFGGMEHAMRQAAFAVSVRICDATRGDGCPGACRCVPLAQLPEARIANDLCVPPGVAP